MFVNKELLGYQLSHTAYSSQTQHDLECKNLFYPAWHLVGLTSLMPRDGDFKTLEMLGYPILVRNHGGKYSAFLNVCSHRHCTLTDAVSGNSPVIRCQYHGWEYADSGQVTRVPDGGCFKPFDREQSKLRCLPLEVCGGLIFVSLSDSPVPIRDFLGDFYDLIQKCSLDPWRHNWHWSHDFSCNWKIPVENTLETYHLPCVHEKTFGGIYPAEAAQVHDLNETHTTLRYQLDESDRLVRRQKRVVRHLTNNAASSEYIHHHIHPHLVFTFTDLFMHTQIYLPTSPVTARTEVWMFSLRGERRGILPRILGPLVARYGRKTNAVIQTEDAGIFGSQQRGISHSPHPGCLGTREERIYVFQQYVQRHASGQSGSMPNSPSPKTPGSPPVTPDQK